MPRQKPDDLFVQNKADLKVNKALTPDSCQISAQFGDGVEALIAMIETWLATKTETILSPVITRARHRAGIETALASIRSAKHLIETNAGAELASEETRLASRALSSLVGEIGVEEVLGQVFSSFCIGK